jgi:hypothetical protein
LWVEEGASPLAHFTASTSITERKVYRMIGGGAAVALGALLPFVSQPEASFLTRVEVHAGARALSFFFGLALVGGALFMRVPQFRWKAGGWTFVGSGLGLCGYSLFAIIGIVGVDTNMGFGITAKVTWSPNIGLLMSIAGCVIVCVTVAQLLRGQRPAPYRPGNWSGGRVGG